MRKRAAQRLMRFATGMGIALGLASWSPLAVAYRPFNSTDADVVKKGELEFEIGPIGYLQEENERFIVAPAIIANAGLFDQWELVLEGRNRIRASTGTDKPRDELGDAALSLKGMLRKGSLQDASGLSVATEVGTLLPTTEPGSGFGALAALILSHRCAIGAAHFNGGGFLGRTHHPGAFAGLIIEGPLTWPVRPVAEGFLEREFDVSTIGSGLAGFIWRAGDNLSFDGAVRAGRAFDMRLAEVRAGLTWAFEL